VARTVRDTNLETRTSRSRLAIRKKPYYRVINQGSHLGYYKGKRAGSWVARFFLGKGRYSETTVGLADDVSDADGVKVLSFSQAQAAARAWFSEQARRQAGLESTGPYTVGNAIAEYLDWYEAHRRSRNDHTLRDIKYRVNAFILPHWGHVDVSKLTPKGIREWQNKLASAPPRVRSGMGQPIRYRDTSDDPETVRKRRHSANKVLTILKAALNHAWHDGKVAFDEPWRRVKPFPNVDAARIRYLTEAECVRLVNACKPDLRQIVKASLLTGCRYGELAAMRVADFNSDAGTVLVHESKNGKPRHVVLTDEGQESFRQATVGRIGHELVFLRGDGKPWGKSHQTRPLADACSAAAIQPPASFHILRHTHASQLALRGVPMAVIAAQLGHSDTRMAEKHYAHLSPSYIADSIRQNFPNLGIVTPSKVTSLATSNQRDGF